MEQCPGQRLFFSAWPRAAGRMVARVTPPCWALGRLRHRPQSLGAHSENLLGRRDHRVRGWGVARGSKFSETASSGIDAKRKSCS